MMGRIFISVDGGGTKTEFCVYSEADDKYETFIYQGSNYKNLDEREDKLDLCQQFSDLMIKTGMSPSDITGIVFGISGIDSEKDLQYYRALVDKTGLDRDRVILCNDCFYTLRGLVEGDGIAIVAGTGGIAYGICDGVEYRTAGWGMPYSDMGCGTWIGGELAREAIMRLDEEAGADDPVIRVVSRYRKEGEELQWTLNAMDVPTVASLARAALELAEQGEPACREIVTESAFYYAGYIAAILKKMRFSGSVMKIVYAGGITKNAYWRSVFEPAAQRRAGRVRLEFILPAETAARNGINYIMREKG